ncbi:MAG: carboxypeptidase-like regulatory domain-containing protein [Tepidisphaeraceae bacterium]
MLRIVKWSLPALAFGVMVALSGVRAGGADDGAAKKSEKVKVSGVVLLEDGSPAAGATVRLMVPGTRKPAEKPADAADKPAAQAADDQKDAAKGADKSPDAEKKPARPEPVAQATTDAAGKFSLEAPAGKYRLSASLKGSGNASKAITVKSGEPMENVELKLKPTAKKAPAQ